MPLEAFGAECRQNTNDVLCIASVWIWRFVPPLLVAIGTVGNIINVVVLLRENLRSKPCFILVFLAVSDMVVLWSFFLLDGLIFGHGIRLPKDMCLFVHFLKYGFGSISLWIVAIFTIERILFVVLPHESNRHVKQAKVMAALCGILVIVLPACGLTFWNSTGSSDMKTATENTSGIIRSVQATMTDHETSSSSYVFTKRFVAFKENVKVPFENSKSTRKRGFFKTSRPNISTPRTPLMNNNPTLSPSTNLEEDILNSDSDSSHKSFHNLSRENGQVSNTDGHKIKSVGGVIKVNRESRRTLLGKADNASSTFNTSNDTVLVWSHQKKQSISDVKQLIYIPQEPCWSPSHDTESFKFTTQMITIFVGGFIPSSTVAIGNVVLYFALFKRKQSHGSDAQSTLLFIISGLVMITITPEVVKSLILITTDQGDIASPLFAVINALSGCITASNYALNFFCYLWKSSLFTEEFKRAWSDIKAKFCKNRIYETVLRSGRLETT